MGIEYDFYPTFTSCKPKLSWNLTKSNSAQQMIHPNWSTPTAKNTSTVGVDIFGTPITFHGIKAYLTPKNSPSPLDRISSGEKPNSRKLFTISFPTPMTFASTHYIRKATDQPESIPQTPQQTSPTLLTPEPAPQNQSIAQLVCYLHHLAFVELMFARAITHNQALPQHPCIFSSGTPENSCTPEQDFIISIMQTSLNLASWSCSAPATSESGHPPLRHTRPFLHRIPWGNSSRGTTSPRVPPALPPASPPLPLLLDYTAPVYPSLATPAPVFIPPPPCRERSSWLPKPRPSPIRNHQVPKARPSSPPIAKR